MLLQISVTHQKNHQTLRPQKLPSFLHLISSFSSNRILSKPDCKGLYHCWRWWVGQQWYHQQWIVCTVWKASQHETAHEVRLWILCCSLHSAKWKMIDIPQGNPQELIHDPHEIDMLSFLLIASLLMSMQVTQERQDTMVKLEMHFKLLICRAVSRLAILRDIFLLVLHTALVQVFILHSTYNQGISGALSTKRPKPTQGTREFLSNYFQQN